VGREVLNQPQPPAVYNRTMPGFFGKYVLLALALAAAAASADAQQRFRHHRTPRETERAAPAVSVDKRDAIVTASGPFQGHPYWLALAQCGGMYFKLNVLYTDAAVSARVIKPDPHANAEYTRKLNEAIRTATTYFDGAENFLRTDRQLDRDNAVLTYDGQSRAAGDRIKTIDAGLAAVRACPALYEACRGDHPKVCNETLAPLG
jgi:hypothetical protein